MTQQPLELLARILDGKEPVTTGARLLLFFSFAIARELLWIMAGILSLLFLFDNNIILLLGSKLQLPSWPFLAAGLAMYVTVSVRTFIARHSTLMFFANVHLMIALAVIVDSRLHDFLL